MVKAGGVIGLIAGVFGFIAAIATLFMGGIGTVFNEREGMQIIGLGWGGIICSFLVIIFSAVSFAKAKAGGICLIISSIAGAILGGGFVAVCLVLSLVGGILILIGSRNSAAASTASTTATPLAADASQKNMGGKVMFCTKCGKSNPADSRFCHSCGNELFGSAASEAGNTETGNAPQASAAAPAANAQQATVPQPKAGKSKQIILIVAGCLAVLIIAGGILGFKADQSSKQTSGNQAMSEEDRLAAAKAEDIDPNGELADIFRFDSKYTDIQRDNKKKEILGKIVHWRLPVYEVSKSGDYYKVQTSGNSKNAWLQSSLGVFAFIKARDEKERKYLEGIKTDDIIEFKGVIDEVFMRNIYIKPAILFSKAPANQTEPAAGNQGATGLNQPTATDPAAAAAGRALEDQLACLTNPEPGKALRAMLANGLLKKTDFKYDGITVLAPTKDIYVYGKKVKFVKGWQEEPDGRVKEPFWRGPGTAPPRFIAVILDAEPNDVRYTERQVKDADGTLKNPFSTMEKTDEFYESKGTSINCYGEHPMPHMVH
jgi:hypothetical protein